jgi:hypothetical protein
MLELKNKYSTLDIQAADASKGRRLS